MILVFGTICLDRVRLVPHLPEVGGYVEIESQQTLLGGEAANTALHLAKWGRVVELHGNPLGEGPPADHLERLLAEHGLSAEHLTRGGGATPETDVYVTPDGERTMFGLGFSTMQSSVDPEHLPFRAGAWFTADPNIDLPARAAARHADRAGMRCYLMDFVRSDDPIPEGGWWQSSTDWVGRRADDEANRGWLEAWIARHRCFAILTDGPRSFWFGGPDRPVRPYPTFAASAVVDTTGAGDAFRAGMLNGLEQGWDVPDCLRFASAAGSLACRSLGATSAIPSEREVQALVESMPEIARAFDPHDQRP